MRASYILVCGRVLSGRVTRVIIIDGDGAVRVRNPRTVIITWVIRGQVWSGDHLMIGPPSVEQPNQTRRRVFAVYFAL